MPVSEYIRKLREKIGHDPLLVPGVTAVVFDAGGQVLLQRSRDDGRWYLPGGAMDPGEQPADAIVREVLEETALQIEPERIVGVYAEEPVRYPNCDVVLYVSITFACGVVAGEARVADDESTEVSFFPVDGMPCELADLHRVRIEHALLNDPRAKFLRGGQGDSRS